MQEPTPCEGGNGADMYAGLAQDIANGAPTSVMNGRILKTIIDDHCRTGASATLIAERLTKHAPQHNGRPWKWETVEGMLDEWRWAVSDARRAKSKQQQGAAHEEGQ